MKKQLRLAAIVAGVAIIAAACGPSGGSAAPTTAASAPPSAAPGASAPESEAPAALSGEVTLWHSYGSGGGETGALNTVLDDGPRGQPGPDDQRRRAAVRPDLHQVAHRRRRRRRRRHVHRPERRPRARTPVRSRSPTSTSISPATPRSTATSRSPSTAPRSTARSTWSPSPSRPSPCGTTRARSPTPPTTSDELLAAVKDGSVKVGINQGVYHQFGWTGAFGGTAHGRHRQVHRRRGRLRRGVRLPQGAQGRGRDRSTPTATPSRPQFQTGKINAIIDGPWQTADFRTALADNLAVAPIPAGPSGPANPFTGTDGWYINPNLDADAGQARGQRRAGADGARSRAGLRRRRRPRSGQPGGDRSPIRSRRASPMPPRPACPARRTPQFGNWWGPFGDALNKVIDTGADPATAVADACALMNEASGL